VKRRRGEEGVEESLRGLKRVEGVKGN